MVNQLEFLQAPGEFDPNYSITTQNSLNEHQPKKAPETLRGFWKICFQILSEQILSKKNPKPELSWHFLGTLLLLNYYKVGPYQL